MAIKISVITPSIRPEGLKVVQESLARQYEQNFEWLVEVGLGQKHDLNAAFNKMIRRAKGDLIVFLEDYTKVPEWGLSKFWMAYKDNPNTLFTAPLGKVNNWSDDNVKWDWRAHKQSEKQVDYTDCGWNTCELDWGAIPKKILFDIGGFDEELDKWWSMDNVSVGKRADLLGYKFKCVFSNPAVAYDHDAHMPHPFRAKFNPSKANAHMNSYHVKPRLDFLK